MDYRTVSCLTFLSTLSDGYFTDMSDSVGEGKNARLSEGDYRAFSKVLNRFNYKTMSINSASLKI